jgi:hypothetical protein
LNRSDEKTEKLVLVVHGVGDPNPGETLSLFARSLADDKQPLLERQEVIWLGEKAVDSKHVQTFPAHQRRISYDERTFEMCEVFWGDLSRVRRGWAGVIQGLFQILFGIRYAAYVAADQPGVAAHWLKKLGLISSRILHGPVLAVTFFLVLLLGAVCGTQLLWPQSYKAAIWTQIVLAGCTGVALAAAGIGGRITRSRVVERFWFWVNVTGMFVAGIMLVKSFWMDAHFPELVHECPIHPGLLWYCRVLVVLLGLLWFIEIQVLLAMAVFWFCAIAHPKAYRPALHIAFLLPALAVGIWGQALPMIWLSAKEGINTLSELPEFAAVFDDAIPLLGVQLMMLVVIMTATSIVIARYFGWRKKATLEGFNSGHRAPRLIVNGSLQLVLAVCTAIGVSIVSTLCVVEMLGFDYREFVLGRLMAEVNKYAVGVIVPLGGLLILLIPKLRPGFDMMLDVVNHFYFRATNVQDALDDDDEFDIAESTFENGTLFFSRRDGLHQRIKRILAHYRDEYTHHPELIIVAHSQGTMIAIEALNDDDLSWLNNCFSSVTLVTMGSPLNHLYQHYFGHCYPALDQPFWSSIRRRLDSWVNVCRMDDFVGTQMDFPTGDLYRRDQSFDQTSFNQTSFNQTVFSNHAVGARGHTNYWSDREVLAILRRELFSQDDFEARRSA